MIHTRISTWQEIEQKFARITDGIGCPIDEGIRDTVIALNVLGVSTLASCEGHLDHGQAAPWVDVGDPEAQPLARQAMRKMQEGSHHTGEAELLQMAAKRLHFAVRRNVLFLLDLFYAEHAASAEHRLIINAAEWGGLSRLESQGAGLQCIAAPDEQACKLAEYQAEMRAFTEFLKRQYHAYDH